MHPVTSYAIEPLPYYEGALPLVLPKWNAPTGSRTPDELVAPSRLYSCLYYEDVLFCRWSALFSPAHLTRLISSPLPTRPGSVYLSSASVAYLANPGSDLHIVPGRTVSVFFDALIYYSPLCDYAAPVISCSLRAFLPDSLTKFSPAYMKFAASPWTQFPLTPTYAFTYFNSQ